jgi:hypothetical protein
VLSRFETVLARLPPLPLAQRGTYPVKWVPNDVGGLTGLAKRMNILVLIGLPVDFRSCKMIVDLRKFAIVE